MVDFPIGVLKLNERASDPVSSSNTGKLYSKDVGGNTHAYYSPNSGSATQIAPVSLTDGTVTYSNLTKILNTNYRTSITASLQSAPIEKQIFQTGETSIFLSGATTYAINGSFLVGIDGGGPSLTLRMGFTGTSTFTSFNAKCFVLQNTAFGLVGAAGGDGAVLTTTASTAITSATSTQLARHVFYTAKAVVNNSGSFIPIVVLTYLSTPPANQPILHDAMIEITPIGSSSFVSQNWS